jgi:hypothetical protein
VSHSARKIVLPFCSTRNSISMPAFPPLSAYEAWKVTLGF